MSRYAASLCLVLGLLTAGFFALPGGQAASALLEEETVSELAQYFGFRGLEVYKLQARSGNLLAGDMNHDGLTDLVLVDNSNSRVDILQQRAAGTPPPPAVRAAAVNAIANDARLEHRKISVDKAIASLSLGDFNGDGRTDFAYLGLPDRLVVRYQPEQGEWTKRYSVRLPDVQLAQWALAAGDLNHDGKDDLAVLGKNEIFVIHQTGAGELASPARVMNTSDKLTLVQVADLDGDKRSDLCYLADDEGGRVLCARLQSGQGQLGPEMRFDLDRPRAVTVRDLDGQPGVEIATIHAQSGRVKLWQWERPQAKAGELASQLIQYGFGQQGAGRDRDLAFGDVNGDGLTDVVVTDPESAQMIVFRQAAGAGLDQGTTFPGLVGTNHVRVLDLNGDKTAEVVVLSPAKRRSASAAWKGNGSRSPNRSRWTRSRPHWKWST